MDYALPSMWSRSYGARKSKIEGFLHHLFGSEQSVSQLDRQTKSNHAIANIAKKVVVLRRTEVKERRRTLEMMVSRAKGL